MENNCKNGNQQQKVRRGSEPFGNFGGWHGCYPVAALEGVEPSELVGSSLTYSIGPEPSQN